MDHIIADTTNWDRDSIRTWLGHKSTIGSEFMLGFDYLKTNEVDAGLAILNNLPNKFELSNSDELDKERSIEVYNIIAQESGNGFTEEELKTLEEIANSYSTFASSFAKNILEKYGLKFPVEDCEHWSGKEDGSQTRDNNLQEQTDDNSSNEFKLVVYPNPGKDQVNFELQSILNENEEINIAIIDVAGNIVSNLNNLESNSKLLWNVENLPSGIYFYEVFLNNNSKLRGKIVIQN